MLVLLLRVLVCLPSPRTPGVQDLGAGVVWNLGQPQLIFLVTGRCCSQAAWASECISGLNALAFIASSLHSGLVFI